MVYSRRRKENNRPQGVDLVMNVYEIPPCKLSQSQEGGFFMLKYYLPNVKTNVSNTIMNVPKAIKSLKSK